MSDDIATKKPAFLDAAAQIAQLWSEIAEIDSEIAPLTSRRDAIREDIKELVIAMGGTISIPGLGTALMTKSGKSASYDAQIVDAIVSELVRNGEIHTAQKLADARKETTRAGYVMLKKEK